MKLRAIRGMNDILPAEVARWHHLEATFRKWAELYGYSEIRTPLIEATSLFRHQIGELTDVVEKEMYSFERHGDELTVRPEGTAGVARAYVEHAVANKEPVTRYYYLGAMFRGERPARGRYRQFYQAGCELFGDPGPACDAEMIAMVADLLGALGIDDVVVHVNSLGASGTRERYRDTLRAYFEPKRAELSEDSQRRLDKNPLRILDSKDERDQALAKGAPKLAELLDAEDKAHFGELLGYLGALGVRHVVDDNLVRGLDYYTRTLFELRSDVGDLGAQNTLCGGGRYDDMVEGLGGPKVPAIGFAMGLERILASMPAADVPTPPVCYVAVLSEGARARALELARDLRRAGVRTELDARPVRLKAMLRRADHMGVRSCALVGDDELAKGVIAIKDLQDKTQQEVPLGSAIAFLAERLSTPTAPPGRAEGER